MPRAMKLPEQVPDTYRLLRWLPWRAGRLRCLSVSTGVFVLRKVLSGKLALRQQCVRGDAVHLVFSPSEVGIARSACGVCRGGPHAGRSDCRRSTGPIP